MLCLKIQEMTHRGDVIALIDGGGSEGQLRAPTTRHLSRAVGGTPRGGKKVDLPSDCQPLFTTAQ